MVIVCLFFVCKNNVKNRRKPRKGAEITLFLGYGNGYEAGLLLSAGLLVALLYAFEKFALEAVFGHLYAHELLGGQYLLELGEVLLLECGALNLHVGQCINHLIALLFGALVRAYGTCLLPYAAINLVLLALQLKVEGEECSALRFGEFGMGDDKLLLLGTELLGSHAWGAGLVGLLLS